MLKRVFIIANPVARKASKRKIEGALFFLKEKGFSPELIYTKGPGDGMLLGRSIIKQNNIYAVIAAGGDGTFNEVANALTGTTIPMAILPLGTTNVLAKELGIPEDPQGAMELLNQKIVSLRPGIIKNNRASRYFLLMAGIGFDATAVYGVNKKLKKFSGKFAYILSGARNFIINRPSSITLIVDNEEIKATSAIISKASCYGGYFKIAPDATLKEPSLYAVIFTQNTRRAIIRYITGVLMGRHIKFRDVLYRKSSKVVVPCSCHIQVDGDYFGKGPAEITEGTEELRFFVPNNFS
jgi:diacylglycerol kinase (ATP)